jgi:hypothetical protein
MPQTQMGADSLEHEQFMNELSEPDVTVSPYTTAGEVYV